MDTSLAIRQLVLNKRQCGKTIRAISEEVSLPKSTVSDIICTGRIESRRKGKCGRKKKLTNRGERMLARTSSAKPLLSARQIKQEHERICKNISVRTIQRSLKNSGQLAYRPVCSPRLSKGQMNVRLEWARRHLHWSVEDWSKVIFSDESAFDISPPKSHFVRRKAGSLPNMLQTKQHRPYLQRLMFWGCFSSNGAGPLVLIDGTMNSQKYVDVLQNYLLPKIRQWYGPRQRACIFQQDNAPCHKAVDTLQFLEQQRLRILDWPPYSPDLSPIENLWAIIKQRLNDEGSFSRADMTEKIMSHWNNSELMNKYIKSLLESMPRRIKAVIENKGGAIKY